MLNINGKEWSTLEPSDIKSMLSEQDFEESFYFEFKNDDVSPKKAIEEVSAFANTFGGYIFLGVSDDKQIQGCVNWNEQRIHTTIHDSITPTPSFDVKKFTVDNNIIYVIKVDEGSEPPYITNSGKIFERLSSGSFTIKDSTKLSQIYNKREQLLSNMEKKISIPPVGEHTNNVYGYIDVGFSVVSSDIYTVLDIFNSADLKSIARIISEKIKSFNLSYIGNSIVYTHGGISTPKGLLPAHVNNFLEIMVDGSARMRILLINNNSEDSSVNMLYSAVVLNSYKEVYGLVMGSLLPDKLSYAKKYESLTVRRQFNPILFYDDAILEIHPDWQKKSDKIFEKLRAKRKIMGTDVVVTDNRIPKTGLYTIDKRQLEIWGMEYTSESILDELFFSRFAALGVDPTLEEDNP